MRLSSVTRAVDQVIVSLPVETHGNRLGGLRQLAASSMPPPKLSHTQRSGGPPACGVPGSSLELVDLTEGTCSSGALAWAPAYLLVLWNLAISAPLFLTPKLLES